MEEDYLDYLNDPSYREHHKEIMDSMNKMIHKEIADACTLQVYNYKISEPIRIKRDDPISSDDITNLIIDLNDNNFWNNLK